MRARLSNPFRRPQHAKGFTLVEVMITLTVIGILTAIALPSYSEYTRKAARADAQLTLQQIANELERVYLQCNSYIKLYNSASSTSNPCEDKTTDIYNRLKAKYSKIPATGTQRYTLDVKLEDQNYLVIATRARGPQSNDRCGNLTLSNEGIRDVSDQTPGVTAEDCWRR